jgi:hypothetical protein
MSQNNSDHVYLNIAIPHNDALSVNGSPTLATFTNNYSQPIISNPLEYEMSIVRFSLPGGDLPIQICPIQPYPNTDPNLTVYGVALSYGTYTTPVQYLEYVPNNTLTIPPAPAAGEGVVRNQYVRYYQIFSYQQIVDMINAAYQAAFINLSANTTPPTGAVAPFMTFNSANDLFTMNAQSDSYGLSYNTGTVSASAGTVTGVGTTFTSAMVGGRLTFANGQSGIITAFTDATHITIDNTNTISSTTYSILYGIRVYMNTALQNLFDESFQKIFLGYNGGIDFEILIKNNENNSSTNANLPSGHQNVYLMVQEFPTLQNFNSLQSILFKTTLISVRNEIRPNIVNNQAGNTQNITNQSPIITDFELNLIQGFDFRSSIHYLPTAEYRITDLTSNSPISQINMDIYWTDNYGNEYQLMIPAHSVVTIKILFRKKKYRYLK